MPRRRNRTLAGVVACLIAGCATPSKPTVTSARRIPTVRTTAYTHREGGSGYNNALGCRLSGQHVMSAASDWSHFPVGTRFRIAETNEEYVIDDYGTALIGTDSIDFDKLSRLEIKRWGVRLADIDNLE